MLRSLHAKDKGDGLPDAATHDENGEPVCCLFTLLFLLGARAVDIVWWIAQPARWNAAFSSALWPILGIIFAPWTTMMWVIVSPGGVNGLDWLWVGLAVVVDVSFWSGGAWGNRGRIPGSSRAA